MQLRDDCQYKQCRGEWKLARVPSARVCVGCVLDYDVASFWDRLRVSNVCFGRASTRPYSYALCAIAVIYSLLRDDCPYSYAMCVIAVIYSLLRDDYPYIYAMIANTSNAGASGSSPAFRPRVSALRVCFGL
ncbi:MAG: hypothetical protein K2G49_03225 [Muribaculum sp.]|nr:hypothetical protein [Muribaculum sp.]